MARANTRTSKSKAATAAAVTKPVARRSGATKAKSKRNSARGTTMTAKTMAKATSSAAAAASSASKTKNTKSSSNNNKSNSKKKQKKKSKQTETRRSSPRPTSSKHYLICPETEEKVWLTVATLEDMKAAKKKRTGGHPYGRGRQYLVTVASPTIRQQVYKEAAAAIQELEQRILPTYGGRKWEVHVSVTESGSSSSAGGSGSTKNKNNNKDSDSNGGGDGNSNSSSKKKKKATNKKSKSPYFIFAERGRLELAAWPHLIERIPNPPRFPGYSQVGVGGGTGGGGGGGNKAKTNGNKNARTSKVKSDESHNQDDNSDTEGSETEEDEEVEEEDEEEEEDEDEELLSDEVLALRKLQDREPSALSRLAYQERKHHPLPNITIKWVSPLRQSFTSRKSAWEHAVELCKQEVHLDKQLLGYGANGQPIQITWPSKKTSLKTGALRFERDGLWVVGQDEQWQYERLREEAEAKEREKAQKEASKTLTPLSYFLQAKKKSHRDKRLRELLQASQDSNIEEVVVADKNDNDNDNSRDRVVAAEEKPSPKNDGEKEQDDASADEQKDNSCDAANQIDDENYGASNNVGDESNTAPTEVGQSQESKPATTSRTTFTIRDAEQELRAIWKQMSKAEQKEWERLCRESQQQQQLTNVSEVESVPRHNSHHHHHSNTNDCGDCGDDMNNNHDVAPAPPPAPPPEEDEIPVKTGRVTPPCELDHGEKEETPGANSPAHVMGVDLADSSDTPIVAPSPPPLLGHYEEKSSAVVDTPQQKEETKSKTKKATSTKKAPNNAKKLFGRPESKHWRLNAEQVRLCYDAGMEHYDQIMHTIKARDLTEELQDGFNLFRERCRGRYDMELPVFETKKFSFLNDLKKTPWMPIVHEILGKDAVLIHKGMFLSMPGASLQPYHQDGVHLTTHYQKPCHAINVFIPLIDLTLQHGPTEFCLGSHVLGHEDYEDAFIVTPTASAGTPIIFDYRLGHRGRANLSNECRPIVYCSYARASDTGLAAFKDSINFSKKRYHQLDDLVEKKPSRAERALKRANNEYGQDRPSKKNTRSSTSRASKRLKSSR